MKPLKKWDPAVATVCNHFNHVYLQKEFDTFVDVKLQGCDEGPISHFLLSGEKQHHLLAMWRNVIFLNR